jgi:hypothetical protein
MYQTLLLVEPTLKVPPSMDYSTYDKLEVLTDQINYIRGMEGENFVKGLTFYPDGATVQIHVIADYVEQTDTLVTTWIEDLVPDCGNPGPHCKIHNGACD